MAETPARAIMVRRLIEAAERDQRIVGLADYGSSSEGRVDVWSDVDVALFLRDADFDAFIRDWTGWAAQFGDLLLAYVGVVGHPWTVYDATPAPLRVDFNFYPESNLAAILSWPNSPCSVEAMVLYDSTGGRLTANARQLVGQDLSPPDLAATFQQVCGDFWYYLLRTHSKLQRGQHWAARFDYNVVILGSLLALLRLEAGAVDRWRASNAADAVEHALTPERLDRLNACIPDTTEAGLTHALATTAVLSREVCQATASQHGWPWPQTLAERVISLLKTQHTAPSRLPC